MKEVLMTVLIVMALCLLFAQASDGASWVQSQNGGMSVRHPQGWKVSWSENGVVVSDPQNPLISCECRTQQASGTSRQFTQALLNELKTRSQNLRVLEEKQIASQPDIHGVKIIYRSQGVPVGMVVLNTTADGKQFFTRVYTAPTKVYDEAKLTLIPILTSFAYASGGSQATPQGNWQVLQSPQGYWRFRAPPGWKANNMGVNEGAMAQVLGPSGELVGVTFGTGHGMYLSLVQKMSGGMAQEAGQFMQQQRSADIPYLSAADLLQRVLLPLSRLSSPDTQITDLKPVSRDEVHYSVSFTDRSQGVRLNQECILRNSSCLRGTRGDFNMYTSYYVSAPPQSFQAERDLLWQILYTFQPSPQFGVPLTQFLARMQADDQQSAYGMLMNNLQANQAITRDFLSTQSQLSDNSRKIGAGWGLTIAGQEIARDRETGERYRVPIGGQYIYGGSSGSGAEVIRSDRALTLSELPVGFREFESMGTIPPE
jgi:hypothetical protein